MNNELAFLPVDPAIPQSSSPAAAPSGVEPTASQPSLCNPEQWVDQYGDYLFRYALMRLRDPVKAEDLVQETFLSALKGAKAFSGRSSEKSWMVGILKNKIADHYRRISRETPFTDLDFYADQEREPFLPDGPFKDGWQHPHGPLEWSSEPGAGLDNAVFWKTFHGCVGKLPKSVAQVFLLREMDDLASDEICGMLNITQGNLWVMLHRARMALRHCLEIHWFGKDNESEKRA